MKKKRRTIAALAALLAGILVLLNAMAYWHAHSMLHFVESGRRTARPESLSVARKLYTLIAGVNIPKPRADRTPGDLGMPFQEISIPVSPNIRLAAWYCEKPGATSLVILFHGYSDEKSSVLLEASLLRDRGYATLLVDFRGSGDSSESVTSIGYFEAEDVRAAVAYAEERFPGHRIALYGRSMGAAAVLRALHVHRLKPDAVILEAVFSSMLRTVENRFEIMGVPAFPGAMLLVYWGGTQLGFDGFEHNPVQYARNIDTPVLFLHGEKDARARLEDARRVYQAVPGPKKLKVFGGTGHVPQARRAPREWIEAVDSFLGSRLP